MKFYVLQNVTYDFDFDLTFFQNKAFKSKERIINLINQSVTIELVMKKMGADTIEELKEMYDLSEEDFSNIGMWCINQDYEIIEYELVE